MKTSKRYNSTLKFSFVLIASSILISCLIVDKEVITVSHNPKLRLDLSPLTNNHLLLEQENLIYGPYRVQSDEIISSLYPNSFSRKLTANLPQSSCLWIGDAGGRGGDWLDASWESTIQLDLGENGERYDALGINTENNDFGICGFSHPVTRMPFNSGISYDFEEVEVIVNGQPATIYKRIDNKVGLVFLASPTIYEETYTGVNSFGAAKLEETTHSAPLVFNRDNINSYGDCANLSFESSITNIAHNTNNSNKTLFSCPSSEYSDTITGCALRCQLKPSRDAQYKLNYYDNEEKNNKVTGLETKFMRVPSSNRKIARQMTRLDTNGNYQWQVAKQPAPSDPSLFRWDENFTPNVQVKNIRFFYLDGNDSPVELTIGQTTQLTASYENSLNVSCLADSTGTFPVGDASIFPHPCGQVKAMTPAYDVDDLSEQNGSVLTDSLQWNIHLLPLASAAFENTKVFIEFELEAKMGPAALMFDPGHVEFEDTEQGSLRQVEIRIKNAGYQPIEVNDIHLTDNHESSSHLSSPGDFRFKLLSAPQVVLFPITGSFNNNNNQPGPNFQVLLSVKDQNTPTISSVLAPIFSFHEDDNLFQTIQRNNLDGQTLLFEGEEITFDGKFGFYQNSNVNFEALVRARLIDSKAELPLGQIFYQDRSLPFVLAPGESQEMLVSFSPNNWGGKSAKISVSGTAIGTSGKVDTNISLFGNSLAMATALPFPESITLPRFQPNRSTGEIATVLTQTLLLVNRGQSNLQRGAINIVGPLSRFLKLSSINPTTQTVTPGNSETLLVELVPRNCSQFVAAINGDTQLEIDTSSGRVLVPVSVDLSYCLPN